MSNPNFIILYVKNPIESAAHYARLLGRDPVDVSPGFAMFSFGPMLSLGLWAAHDVQPAATAAGGAEVGFAVPSRQAVAELHARWSALNVPVIQAPVDMDFGHTFTALDLDGHRLRVFAPHPA